MTMLDSFEFDEDKPNAMATTIYRRMKSYTHTDNTKIYGNVYIGNETDAERVDFTRQDLTSICNQTFTPQKPKMA